MDTNDDERPKGELVYPDDILGVAYVKKRLLVTEGTHWDYRVTTAFTDRSARRLITQMPEGQQLTFADPYSKGKGSICVRRDKNRYYSQPLKKGARPIWTPIGLNELLELFFASPLVAKPDGENAAFSLSAIPAERAREHLDGSRDIWRKK